MKVKVTQSHPTLCNPMDYICPWNSPGQNTAVGSLSLLQGIFPTQGSNPGLPHYKQILYQLSHRGSPKILEWIVYLFSSRSSQSRNQTRASWIAGGFFTTEPPGKPLEHSTRRVTTSRRPCHGEAKLHGKTRNSLRQQCY